MPLRGRNRMPSGLSCLSAYPSKPPGFGSLKNAALKERQSSGTKSGRFDGLVTVSPIKVHGLGRPFTRRSRCLLAATLAWPLSYLILAGREPRMRMSTSLFALSPQSGADATLATPTSARSRSTGSRSGRMSPLSIARVTNALIAPMI